MRSATSREAHTEEFFIFLHDLRQFFSASTTFFFKSMVNKRNEFSSVAECVALKLLLCQREKEKNFKALHARGISLPSFSSKKMCMN